jgi:hypothetical protein
MTCDKPMRDGPCVMDLDHRGRHTTVGFYCDCCGKTRRGTPESQLRDINGTVDVVACWFCVNVTFADYTQPALSPQYY